MVRNPKTLTNGSAGWVAGEEDYVFLSFGRAANNHPSCSGCPAPHFEVKSTINSNSTLAVSSIDTTRADIRMVRLGAVLFVLYRFPGQSWTVHQRYYRDDLVDSVQVGMVTYTDWDKASTYETTFHNSHIMNEDLDPDPSNNPGQPFAPDIITRYDYLQLLSTSLPAAWNGLDLMNAGQVSNAEILNYYGSVISTPAASSEHVWLGRENGNWNDPDNWLTQTIPGASDSVRINSCVCEVSDCVQLGVGTTTIAGLELSVGAVLTIPVGAVLQIHGPLVNAGEIIVFGELQQVAGFSESTNRGIIDCRAGGVFHINE
jgi:hypothetical protein